MQFNLFSWVREGVKRSVMLGVADAIEQVGTPPSNSGMQTGLQNFLKQLDDPIDGSGSSTATATAAALGTKTSSRAGGRKRLGRSLKEFDT